LRHGSLLQVAEHMEALYGAKPAALTGGPLGDLVSELEPAAGGSGAGAALGNTALMKVIAALEPMEIKKAAKKTSMSIASLSEASNSQKSMRLDGPRTSTGGGGGGLHPGGLSARGVVVFGVGSAP